MQSEFQLPTQAVRSPPKFPYTLSPSRARGPLSTPDLLPATIHCPKAHQAATTASGPGSTTPSTRKKIVHAETPPVDEREEKIARGTRFFVTGLLKQLFPPAAKQLNLKVISPEAVEHHLRTSLPQLEGEDDNRYHARSASVIDTRMISHPYRAVTPKERKRVEFTQPPPQMPLSPFGTPSRANPDASCLLHKDAEFRELLQECYHGTAVAKANNKRKALQQSEVEYKKEMNEAAKHSLERLHKEEEAKPQGVSAVSAQETKLLCRSGPLRKRKEVNRMDLVAKHGGSTMDLHDLSASGFGATVSVLGDTLRELAKGSTTDIPPEEAPHYRRTSIRLTRGDSEEGDRHGAEGDGTLGGTLPKMRSRENSSRRTPQPYQSTPMRSGSIASRRGTLH